MIESSAKITIDNTDTGTLISIFPQLKPWQIWLLRIWLIIWAITGLLAMMGMLRQGAGDQIVYLVVFAAFWLYFIYYAGRSVIWHQSGSEYLRIGAETIDYKRSWGTYGKAYNYDLNTIKDLGLVNLDGKTFARTYQNAFWTVGGEQIGFEYLGKKIVFGLRLTETDAKKVVKLIENAVRSRV